MTTIPEGWPTDEMIEAGASALAAHGLHTGTAHVWSRVVLKAALAAAPPTVSDMQAFGASDAACYKWPGDTPEHKALRAAYIAGAADVFPAAYLASRPTEGLWESIKAALLTSLRARQST